MALSDVPIG